MTNPHETPSVAPFAAHVITIDRKLNCACPTLADEPRRRVEAALRNTPWWRDRLGHRRFRQAVAELSTGDAQFGGLVFLGPRMPFAAPPPFADGFEPIQFGTRDPQLMTLGGEAPTREERQTRFALYLVGIVALAALLGVIIGAMRGSTRTLLLALTALPAALTVGLGIAFLVSRATAPWYLVPGALIVVGRGKSPRPFELLTPARACAMIRYVRAGKTVIRMLELWDAAGRSWRRPVSEREAIAFLAGWQSPHPPPPRERLAELVG